MQNAGKLIRTFDIGGLSSRATSPRPSGSEIMHRLRVSSGLLQSFGDGRHGRQLGLGRRRGSLSCGLLGLGRLGLSSSLLLVGDDAHVLLLAQRLFAAHLLDLLLGNVADGRKERRRGARATAGYTARVVVGEDGLGEELQVFVGNVGADTRGVAVVGKRISSWPTWECAAGVDLCR